MSKFVKTIVALFVFALVLAPMAAFAQEDGGAAAAAGLDGEEQVVGHRV